MPVFTVTAVNTGTETLTATGHGLLTGDRFRLRNSGGALPAATPALAPVTDYFAIRVDADNIKVAVSSSDASAGTAVNLTGSGSGTQFIEYNLPYCVPRIAANGSQVLPQDDNAAWQALVALYDLLTGQSQSIWASVNLVVPLTFSHGTRTLQIHPSSVNPTTSGGGGLGVGGWTSATAIDAYFPIILDKGKRILAVRAYVNDNTTGPTTVNCRLMSTGSAGASVTIGTSSTSSGAGTAQTLSITGLTTTVAALTSYVARITAQAGNAPCTVFMLEVDYDQP